jgi:hypothetical protein
MPGKRAGERVDSGADTALATGARGGQLAPDLRLQILTTEHWSLLSTRSLSWNESFSRAAMFLSALSGAVVALALVASSFREGVVTFALLILPVVLFLGLATFVRLVEINHEDVRWVIGMNLLRHAYLEDAPELHPYFITGWHDDEAGIMATFGARPGPGRFAHEFVTAPGVIAIVDGVLAGVLTAIVGTQVGVEASLTLAGSVAAGLLTIVVLALYQYRGAVRPRAMRQARFPADAVLVPASRPQTEPGRAR